MSNDGGLWLPCSVPSPSPSSAVQSPTCAGLKDMKGTNQIKTHELGATIN